MVYDSLQVREIFHLEFLRWLGRKVKPDYYAVKGGTNLRFFFKSFRYSEDMDLDISGLGIITLRDIVMKILQTASFRDSLEPFGIRAIIPPDMGHAKQTQTTQRFKIHLITTAEEDLFTKVEFSRRGFKGEAIVQPVLDIILREYKLPPLLAPHYNIHSAAMQKIEALAARSVIQARDIFDLYILSSQFKPVASSPPSAEGRKEEVSASNAQLTKAYDNIFEVSFEQFRDTVISYLSPEDQSVYNSSSIWDEIKLKASNFIDELRR